MCSLAARVRNADRMMTLVSANDEGVIVSFADGREGLVPFTDLPEVGGPSNLVSIDLPNPYEAVLHTAQGDVVELPWDFARHYCDVACRPRVETIAAQGRAAIGSRVRTLREAACMIQEQLAAAAGIGRVTLVRIEGGEQSPRYETLTALAAALGKPVAALLVREPRAA